MTTAPADSLSSKYFYFLENRQECSLSNPIPVSLPPLGPLCRTYNPSLSSLLLFVCPFASRKSYQKVTEWFRSPALNTLSQSFLSYGACPSLIFHLNSTTLSFSGESCRVGRWRHSDVFAAFKTNLVVAFIRYLTALLGVTFHRHESFYIKVLLFVHFSDEDYIGGLFASTCVCVCMCVHLCAIVYIYWL